MTTPKKSLEECTRAEIEERLGPRLHDDPQYRRLPAHMRETAKLWVEDGLPSPIMMGSFFRAALLHDFMQMVAHGDYENRNALLEWALWLHNDCPGGCHGSEEILQRWHEVGGFKGFTGQIAAEKKP